MVGEAQRGDVVVVEPGRIPEQVHRLGAQPELVQVDLAAVGGPQRPGAGQQDVRLLAAVEQPVGDHFHGQACRECADLGFAGGRGGPQPRGGQVHQQDPGKLRVQSRCQLAHVAGGWSALRPPVGQDGAHGTQHGLAGEQSPGDSVHRAVERLAHVIGHRIVQPGQEPVPVDIGQFRVVRGMVKRGQD